MLSDDVLLIDAASGTVRHRFDLSTGPVVPSTYPIAVTATRDGKRGFAALWNGSAVAELDLRSGKVIGALPLLPPTEATAPSSHPTALALSPNQKTLYVALANRDAVAGVSLRRGRMKLAGIFDTRLPGQTYFGGEPNALALSEDGRHLYAANAGTDSVAIFRTRGIHRRHAEAGRRLCAHGVAAHGACDGLRPSLHCDRQGQQAPVPTSSRSGVCRALRLTSAYPPILRLCSTVRWPPSILRSSMHICPS